MIKSASLHTVSLISALGLAISALAAVPAPAAAEGTPEGFELVHFPSRDGDLTNGAGTLIAGYLKRPIGDGPHPAILALHGCSGLKRPNGRLPAREADWAERLVAAHYVVLFADSFAPRGIKESCTRTDMLDFPHLKRPRDAYGALLWLQAQPFVRADRIGLLGWSNGAIATLATLDERAPARPHGLAHDFRAAVAFYPGCSRILRSGDWRTGIPLVILMGGRDDWTGAANCERLAARAKAADMPVELKLYPGAYHDFDAPDMPIHVRRGLGSTVGHTGTATLGTDPVARADALDRASAFFARYLKD